MNVIGSWNPVVRDEHYQAKRDAGLIGAPHEYSSPKEIEADSEFISALERPESSAE